ncbi:Cytochrome p450, partial [Thalictrum thalictroides]
DMFLAGTDTSSTLMEWTFTEMLRNPSVMEKAQEEVRRIFNGKKKIDQADIDKLNYLRLVIKESLRLHPPAPFLLPRECRERCEIEGYEIPKGSKVLVNVWAMGRDPENWKDPESFEPERFQDMSIDYKGTNFKYIPFGAGRRICPGILFGIANVELPLALLLYHFDWKLANGVKPEELDMTEVFSSVVRRKENLHVIPTSYNPS